MLFRSLPAQPRSGEWKAVADARLRRKARSAAEPARVLACGGGTEQLAEAADPPAPAA